MSKQKESKGKEGKAERGHKGLRERSNVIRKIEGTTVHC